MPAHYAHYYFGLEVIKQMPAPIKKIINTNGACIDAFSIGLQGPDILAYDRPYRPNALSLESSLIHHRSGLHFFRSAVDYVKEDPTPENYSYLLGFLCHYMLDSACHPLVKKAMKATDMTHSAVEREFDMYVLKQRDRHPIGMDPGFALPMNRTLALIVSPFYHSCGPRRIQKAVGYMKLSIKALSHPSSRIRTAEYRTLSVLRIKASVRDKVEKRSFDPRSKDSNRALYQEMQQCVPDTIREMELLINAISTGEALSDRLKADFLGKMPRK